jgi:glycosyltransferase involved in cell wall biosynthesis
MPANSLVSVIIPCYNQAQYLPDALESVLAQTYLHWECIIVNDGSPDNTEEVSKEWLTKDKRFRYFRKENGGLSSARNAGLSVAQGDFIQFLDADDVIHPEKFTVQVKELQNTPDNSLGISDYFSSLEDLENPYLDWHPSPKFKTGNHLSELISEWEAGLSIPVHCFLFKSALFNDNHIRFNETLPNHEDWECWINIFRTNPEVRYTDQKLATYRIREKAMCHDKRHMKIGFLKVIEIQKEKFDVNSDEYKMLCKKANYIKFGVNSTNFALVFLGMIYWESRSIAGIVKRKLRKSH